MDRVHDYYQSYSWHQSHDQIQATVLLLVPYETVEEDVSVSATPFAKYEEVIAQGRLYGNIDTVNSVWQLEPRASRLSARERTTSTTSTVSTQSSYALVSDPEISSSFAASLDSGLVSDIDDAVLSSPALSSPISSSMDEHMGFMMATNNHRRSNRVSLSPPSHPAPPFSHASSFSSLESLHSSSGRLLTIHLEKAESVIWPSLIVGPVIESLSPNSLSAYPWRWTSAISVESKYNMDPTSLVLIALDLYDIRKSKEEAFEYFVRAWHQAHVPSATIRLATHYLPLQTVIPESAQPASSSSSSTVAESPDLAVPQASSTDTENAEPSTPTIIRTIPSVLQSLSTVPSSPPSRPTPGTTEYYLDSLGGLPGLAQLFLEAGLLHLEGAAIPLLSSAYAGLSSLRAPTHSHSTTSAGSPGATDAWRRDREIARRYFERARTLSPALDVPLLPPDVDSDSGGENGDRREMSPGAAHSRRRRRQQQHQQQQFEMPSVDIHHAIDPSESQPILRRRRKHSEDLSSSLVDSVHAEPDAGDDDRTWYLYIPGLVGAGTALLVVGFLSFSSWRKSQGS
ncbi:hypothetical protein A0H81_07803 [Grifola frondosa]|uniref:CS domain-containing protein n=1 Tax=Grifola frondosa TaxID=5627 RepID=A0A1C7M5D2_GRIFR|nr:hypothetical protein A0H81_07803 [Grifola frondosa]